MWVSFALNPLLKREIPLKVTCALQQVRLPVVGLRFTTRAFGVPSVMMGSPSKMPMWLAVNWASQVVLMSATHTPEELAPFGWTTSLANLVILVSRIAITEVGDVKIAAIVKTLALIALQMAALQTHQALKVTSALSTGGQTKTSILVGWRFSTMARGAQFVMTSSPSLMALLLAASLDLQVHSQRTRTEEVQAKFGLITLAVPRTRQRFPSAVRMVGASTIAITERMWVLSASEQAHDARS